MFMNVAIGGGLLLGARIKLDLVTLPLLVDKGKAMWLELIVAKLYKWNQWNVFNKKQDVLLQKGYKAK